jgi:soluble lytic murein transglycosylase-like protein
MKPFISLAVCVLLALTAGKAFAQEANTPTSVETNVDSIAGASQLLRTPAMVVHEIAIPVQKLSADTPRPPLAPSKKPDANAVSSAPAMRAHGPIIQPMFMPGPVSSSDVPEMTTTGNPKYDEFIAKSATRNGIDPNLMVAVMRQESGFNPRARSYKGATGLMQLMPATAARFGVTNIYDAAQNIEGGAKYLRFLLDTFNGDVDLTLAGYNAGEHAVMNSGYRVPRYRETQNYVKSISARYDRAKNREARSPRKVAAAVAPSAETFSNGRFSNNY